MYEQKNRFQKTAKFHIKISMEFIDFYSDRTISGKMKILI